MPNNDILNIAKDALDKAIAERKRNKDLISSLGPAIVDALTPALEDLARNSKVNKDEMLKAMKGVTINLPEINIPSPNIKVNVPDVNVTHEVNIPAIRVPQAIVRIPEIKIPTIQIPDEMNVKGWVSFMGYDRGMLTNPLPVQIRDSKGNPVDLNSGGMMMSGGGGSPNVNIIGATATVGVVTINPDGSPFYASSSSGASSTVVTLINNDGLAYNSDNPLSVTGSFSSSPVLQVSGATDSVNVAMIAGNPTVVGSGYQDNALRVVLATDSVSSVNVVTTVGLTDTQLRASTLDIKQVSGSTDSVYVNNPVDNGDSATALRVVLAGNASASVSASQAGTWNITTLTGITNSLAANIVDSGGIPYTTSNPLPIGDAGGSLTVDGTVAVSGITNTVAAANIDSSGVQYSGSNPFPFTLVTNATATVNAVIVDSGGVGYNGTNPMSVVIASGSLNSTISVGDSAARTADNGGNPLKVGGIARTTNPAAYADGDRSNMTTDKLGRQLVRPIQVRELLATAYTTISTGTETTILTAGAGTYLDCIWMAFANTSGVAQQIDIRNVSAGNIVHSIMVPASGTAGWAPPVPWPQDATGNAWTADGADVTGSTVYITSLFSKEI